MKNRAGFKSIAGIGAAFLILSCAPATQDQDERYQTLLTAEGRGIVRRPAPSSIDRGLLEALPSFEPSSRETWQIDLRGKDLRALDLSDRGRDLLMAHFDDNTQWPAELPDNFDPALIMKWGKSPGLGVRELHKNGITGKGVGIAIIDQALLVDHAEYQDRIRLYEEIHCGDETATMHGAAVASIAAGKTIGVAPEADIYYIGETHGEYLPDGFAYDFTHLAKSIDRILEINRSLPENKKIRVMSLTIGWSSRQKGYAEVTAAVERATKEGIFCVSSSIFQTSGRRFAFHGLGREPDADPEAFGSYGPGIWWIDNFYSGNYGPVPNQEVLLVPMDSRTTAGPTAADGYAFYRVGGWSWSIPWIAGLYALACQAKPDITPEIFWNTALSTGDSIEIPPRGEMPAARPKMSEDEIEKQVAKIVDEQMAKFDERFGKGGEREKAMAEIYNQATGEERETMTESEFRAWGAELTRNDLMGVGQSTKPVILQKIVNPRKLIEVISK